MNYTQRLILTRAPILQARTKQYNMEKEDMKKPGSAWGTGRPSTGRTHPVTVRLSDLAIAALGKVKNKSSYIDSLIRVDYLQRAQLEGK